MNDILSRFALEGTPISCARYGSGHINETYLAVTNRPHLYILQRLNGFVFPNLRGVMDNIVAVTNHLRQKTDDPSRTLTLVPTRDGRDYLVTEQGDYWRLYEFVLNSVCLEKAESVDDFRQSAAAFGEFQNQLADFPVQSLVEIIPRFHDTPQRFRQLHAAIESDPAGRAAGAREEIQGYLAYERDAGELMNLLKNGDLPLRVTHNDTKLNNVLLRESDHRPLCVIDLDTVMPGLAAWDFGDAIRYGANDCPEDEPDPNKVHLNMEKYETYLRGYLDAAGAALTPLEKETLPWGARVITLETGIRFLTDYLEGDHYFRIRRPNQNLDRTRKMLKLTEDMEAHFAQMGDAVARYGRQISCFL
jgi:Ser/Thr protein kinase RdoA (MazF antagonist)